MDYYICEAKTTAELRDEVDRYMHKGWSPIGGVAVIQSASTATWWFYQAMVLKNPEHASRREPELA